MLRAYGDALCDEVSGIRGHTGTMSEARNRSEAKRVASPSGAHRIISLEVVRGVAAAVVLLHHTFAAESAQYEEWTRNVIDPGRIGVVMFFVVSGYVIPLSLDKQSLSVFAIRRLFRLFPLYWFALALYAMLDPTVRDGDHSSIVWVVNVIMLQGLLPIATLIPTAWTLGIEMAFYVQAAVFHAYFRRVSADALGYGWLAAFALAMLAQGLLGRPLPATGALLLFTAAIGHVFYLVQHRGLPSARLWSMVGCGLVVVPVASLLGGRVDPDWPPFVYGVSWMVGILGFAVVNALGRFVGQRLATFLGSTSYAVYLLHPLVHGLLEDRFGPVVLFVFATCAVTYTLSYLVHRFLEAPMIRVGRRLTGAQPRITATSPSG